MEAPSYNIDLGAVYTLRKYVLEYDDITLDTCKLRMKILTLVFELVKGLAMLAWVLIAVTYMFL